MKKLNLIAVFFITLFFTLDANASIFNKKTFFVSLKANEVNMRTGPGTEYPIKYMYRLKGVPIQVLGEYESWYKVKDKDGDEGWLNKNLVSKSRNVIIVGGTQILYSSNSEDSRPIYRLEENLVVEFKKCKKEWCKVKIRDRKGWIKKEVIWGVK